MSSFIGRLCEHFMVKTFLKSKYFFNSTTFLVLLGEVAQELTPLWLVTTPK